MVSAAGHPGASLMWLNLWSVQWIATLIACRFTSSTAKNVSKTVRSWSDLRTGRGLAVPAAAPRSFRKSFPSLHPRCPQAVTGEAIALGIPDLAVSVALGSPIRTECPHVSLVKRERENGFLHSPSESAPDICHIQELARSAFSTAASGWVL